MRLLVIAGAIAVVAGGVAIWFGIPVKEFSFGNTLILTGAIAICSGLLLIGLGLVVRELKAIKRSLMESMPVIDPREIDGPPLPAGSIVGRGGRMDRDAFEARPVPPEVGGSTEPLGPSGSRRDTVSPPDPRDAPVQDAVRPDIDMESGKPAPEVAPPAPPPVKERRNLLFTSSRRERERSRAGSLDSAVDAPVASAEPAIGNVAGRGGEPHPSFNRAPGFTRPSTQVERATDAEPVAPRRAELRAPSPQPGPPPSPAQAAPAATVVKSGAVDGMAYSLYSDGSIEAQMPEGMMRFASIEHLRAHLDRDR